MTHVNHQELTLAKKTPPAFHDPMLNNPNTKHHTQSLLQVMKTFKNGYTTHKERSHSMHSAATLVKQTIELNQESSNAIHQKSSM